MTWVDDGGGSPGIQDTDAIPLTLADDLFDRPEFAAADP